MKTEKKIKAKKQRTKLCVPFVLVCMRLCACVCVCALIYMTYVSFPYVYLYLPFVLHTSSVLSVLSASGARWLTKTITPNKAMYVCRYVCLRERVYSCTYVLKHRCHLATGHAKNDTVW